MPKSSSSRKRRKATSVRPEKPYPDFPLYAHPAGYWAKKIRREFHYFGRWGKQVQGRLERLPFEASWKAALDLYKEQADDLHAGRTPRVKGDGLTVGDLCARFLTDKSNALDAGEITARTYSDYRATADRLLAAFKETRLVDDLSTRDFALLRKGIAKVWGPVRLGNEIQRVRTVFKYGFEEGLIDRPMRFGPSFKKPAKKVLRKHRAESGGRMFEAADVRAMLGAAPVALRAMILLGVNCGFGNSDCGTLPLSAVDLKNAWIKFPRPKTGIERRCSLWPETVTALKAAIAERPSPKSKACADLLFVTKYGKPWARDIADSPVTKETRKLLDGINVYKCKCSPRVLKAASDDKQKKPAECKTCKGQLELVKVGMHRAGFGFYSLRHTFRTIADATRDFPAIRLIMGHADESIDDVYREHIDDSRLQAVTDHVRAWLWPQVAGEPTGNAASKPKAKRPAKAMRKMKDGDAAGPRLRIVG